ncbi:CAP domain-containing protein [Chitinophaga lutea]
MIRGLARQCAALAILCLALYGCTKEPLTQITPPPPAPVGDTTFLMNNPVNKALLLQLVNDRRAQGCRCGDTTFSPAPPLQWNTSLERAAYLHSKDMNENDYFAHSDAEGNNGGKRIARMGYAWYAWGENLAMGILTESTVVQGWFNSPTHCRVLMDPRFTDMGTAKVAHFWSQELAVPKQLP